MKFDELRTEWAAQKQEDMYTINQEALRQRVAGKKAGANRFSDLTEKMIMGINLVVGAGLLVASALKGEPDVAPYLIGLTILLMGVYVVYVRMQRLRASGTFDRTISGDLEQAISDTRHRVRISRMALLLIPVIALFSLYHLWNEDKPVWVIGLVAVFFLLASLAGGWEHRNWHLGKLKSLERMRDELTN